MRLRRLAAVLAAAGVLVTAAPHALASHNRGQDVLLSPTDVFGQLGKPKDYLFSNKTLERTLAPCAGADGRDIAPQVAPLKQFESTVSSERLGYMEVAQRVYEYPSADAATAAFGTLRASAANCTGDSTAGDGAGGTIRATLSNGSRAGASFPYFWVQEVARYSATDGKDATVDYSVFARVGKAVIRVSLYRNDDRPLPASQRGALDDLALALAERWANQ